MTGKFTPKWLMDVDSELKFGNQYLLMMGKYKSHAGFLSVSVDGKKQITHASRDALVLDNGQTFALSDTDEYKKYQAITKKDPTKRSEELSILENSRNAKKGKLTADNEFTVGGTQYCNDF
jgi:hypothetical protein